MRSDGRRALSKKGRTPNEYEAATSEAPLRAASEAPLRLRCLLPPGEPMSVAEIVARLGLGELANEVSPTVASAAMADRPSAQDSPAGPARRRPYLALNMVSTADGRATVEGRSGPIGEAADRQLFHGLRTTVDAVMAGAGTIRVERYRRIVREEPARDARRARGLADEPWAVIVSGRLDIPPDTPLLTDPAVRVVILTASAASLPLAEGGAEVKYIRAAEEGLLDLPAAIAELYERFGVNTIMCEGGPHLNSHLLAAGLVDELFLSLSPKLAGGDPSGEALRIVSGPGLDPLVELDLIGLFEHESHLFLRYRVRRT